MQFTAVYYGANTFSPSPNGQSLRIHEMSITTHTHKTHAYWVLSLLKCGHGPNITSYEAGRPMVSIHILLWLLLLSLLQCCAVQCNLPHTALIGCCCLPILHTRRFSSRRVFVVIRFVVFVFAYNYTVKRSIFSFMERTAALFAVDCC